MAESQGEYGPQEFKGRGRDFLCDQHQRAGPVMRPRGDGRGAGELCHFQHEYAVYRAKAAIVKALEQYQGQCTELAREQHLEDGITANDKFFRPV